MAFSVPLIVTPYISRVLGTYGVGLQSYVSSISSIFVLFIMLGVQNYGNREIASRQDNVIARSKVFFEIWGFQIVCGIIVGIAYCIFCYINKQDYDIYCCLCINGITLLAAMFDISWFFYGIEKIKIVLLRNAIVKVATVCLIFTFVNNTDDIWKYILIISLGSFLSNIIILTFLKKEVVFLKPSLNSIVGHYRGMIVLFIPVIAVSIYRTIDKIFIGYFSDIDQLGLFDNAEKVINIPISLIAAIGMVMMPRMTFLFEKKQFKSIKSYMDTSFEFVSFLSVGMTLGLVAISQDLVPVFLGEDFINVVEIIYILSPSIIFINFANIIRTQYLIPGRLDIIYIRSLWLGALISVMINLLLIPFFGAIGGAVGTSVAEMFVAIYQSIKTYRQLEFKKYIRCYIRNIVFGGLMVASIFVLREVLPFSNLLFIYEILVGSIVYISCGLIFVSIKKTNNSRLI